jgi:hypothetical protein
MNIEHQIERLQSMTVGQLRELHEQVFGESTRSGNRVYLWRRIAWRIQEIEQGGLSERALRRAEELAENSSLRARLPKGTFSPPGPTSGETVTRPFAPLPDGRLPAPGGVISRSYHGRKVDVRVLDKGFEYEGKRYRSLSGIARAITGSNWNGFAFFGLAGDRGAR